MQTLQTREGDSPDRLSAMDDIPRLRRIQPPPNFERTDADAFFNFAVHMCWRANKPIWLLRLKKCDKWLISAWATASMEVTEDCKIQNKMMQTFWERQKEMMLTQLGV